MSCLFEAVEALEELLHPSFLCRKLGIHESRKLLHEDWGIHLLLQVGILDIHLEQIKTLCSSQGNEDVL